MRVSKSTVVEAYERLVAEGAIQARRGSGFYVAGQLPPLSLADLAPRLDRSIDPLWVSRQSLEGGNTLPMPGCGWLPASWMAEEGLRRALRSLARAEPEALADYGTPLGLLPLRELLARRLNERGVEVAPRQVMLTESGTHAVDLVCRFLLEPGETVLVDDPCYFNFHALLRAHRSRVVGVPYTPTGPDLARFEQALAEHKPRLYITNSAVQNPSGATLSAATAHRLLGLAEQAGLTIVEDDIFADFEHKPAARLSAFDGLDRVIQIGSFSKSLSASVRCGFIAARADWIEALTDLKIATTFGGGRLSAEIVHRVLKDGSYRRHMEAVRERLARAREEAMRGLARLGIVPWHEPQAGMFLWCALPDGIDAAALARQALARGVVLAPGPVFSSAGTASRFMRFNAAQMGDPRVMSALEEAMAEAASPDTGTASPLLRGQQS